MTQIWLQNYTFFLKYANLSQKKQLPRAYYIKGGNLRNRGQSKPIESKSEDCAKNMLYNIKIYFHIWNIFCNFAPKFDKKVTMTIKSNKPIV